MTDDEKRWKAEAEINDAMEAATDGWQPELTDVSGLDRQADDKCILEHRRQAERLWEEGRHDEAQDAVVRMLTKVTDGAMTEAEVGEWVAGLVAAEGLPMVLVMMTWFDMAVTHVGLPVTHCLYMLDLVTEGVSGAVVRRLPDRVVYWIQKMSKEDADKLAKRMYDSQLLVRTADDRIRLVVQFQPE